MMRFRSRPGCRFALSALVLISLAPTASGVVYDVHLPIGQFGYAQQLDVPGFGNMACGPTSMVNSLVFLQNEYPSLYPQGFVPPQDEDYNGDGVVDFYDDMIGTVVTLGGEAYMRTATLGYTPRDCFMYGAQQYIEEHNPGVTAYAAQTDFWWPFHPQPAWCEGVNPTWQFLYDSLVAGAAVQIAIANPPAWHYVSLTDFHWDDANNDGNIDFGEDAWIGCMDPWTGEWGATPIWQEPGVLATPLFPDSEIVWAFSQTPIPAPPAALALLTLGAGAMRRRALVSS